MVVTRGAQRALILVAFVALLVVYVFAWLAPAIGLYHDDGVYLVTARSLVTGQGYSISSLPHPVAQTKYPPLFPALLGLFSLISMNPQWLKLLPLCLACGWLFLTWKLLRKMGATWNGALFLVFVTAASPTVIFLSTNLMSEPLFALLATASLLILIDGKNPLLAGCLAGLATITRVAGVPLIAAGIFVYLIRRRIPDALQFTVGAMVFAAPWFGWAAAHRSAEPYYGWKNYSGLSMISAGLGAAEKFRVVAFNVVYLAGAPYNLLTGMANIIAAGVTAVLLSWALAVRRQLIPDLFLLFYCLLLLTWAGPPQRFVAPILPLVLWLIWRWIQAYWQPEAIVATGLVLMLVQFTVDYQRLPETRRSGVFTMMGKSPNEWPQMQILCKYIREETPQASVVLANLDPMIFLQTGRRAVRGFNPNGYDLFYASARHSLSGFELAKTVRDSQVDYVVVTPDRDFAEAPGFRAAVLTMERDGMVEPLPVPGLTAEYRVWKVTRSQ